VRGRGFRFYRKILGSEVDMQFDIMAFVWALLGFPLIGFLCKATVDDPNPSWGLSILLMLAIVFAMISMAYLSIQGL
jgi:hypothetical protein